MHRHARIIGSRMAKTDADQDQLSLRVSKQLNAELITLAGDYRMTKRRASAKPYCSTR